MLEDELLRRAFLVAGLFERSAKLLELDLVGSFELGHL